MHSRKSIYFISLLFLAVASTGYSQTIKPEKFYNNFSSTVQRLETTSSFMKSNLQFNVKKSSVVVDSMLCKQANGDRFKYDFSYNNRSQISSYFIDLQDDGRWTNHEKYTYDYYENGNKKSSLAETWNGTGWIPYYKQSVEYDENGYMSLFLAEDWNGTEWVTDYLQIQQNDAGGNMIYADYTNGDFRIIGRFEYDPNGLLITETDSVKNEGASWQYYLTSKTYNPDKNVISELDKIMIGDVWVNYNQITYEYDSDKNLILESEKRWNESSESWKEHFHYKYEYDDNNNNTSVVCKSWDETSGSWINKERYTYKFNSAGNILSELYEKTDDSQNWVNIYRYNYGYDEQGYFTNGAYEEWFENSWIPADGYFQFDDPAGYGRFYTTTWQLEKVYYGTTTGIAGGSPAVNNYSLSQNYPNPFNPTTSIEYQVPGNENVTLKVYDILGNEVATLVNEQKPTGAYQVQFNSADLSSGVYFHKLETGNSTSVKKLLLLK